MSREELHQQAKDLIEKVGHYGGEAVSYVDAATSHISKAQYALENIELCTASDYLLKLKEVITELELLSEETEEETETIYLAIKRIELVDLSVAKLLNTLHQYKATVVYMSNVYICFSTRLMKMFIDKWQNGEYRFYAFGGLAIIDRDKSLQALLNRISEKK